LRPEELGIMTNNDPTVHSEDCRPWHTFCGLWKKQMDRPKAKNSIFAGQKTEAGQEYVVFFTDVDG